MTQNQAILKFLKNEKSLNPLQALNKFGCFRLASRINELRKTHKINREMVTVGGSTFAQYSLA